MSRAPETEAFDKLTAEQVREIVDSDPMIRVYAAPEWAELSEDGQAWTVAFANEVLRRHAKAEGC